MNNPILSFSAIRRMRSVRTPVLITLYSLALAALAYFTVYGRFMGATVTVGGKTYSMNIDLGGIGKGYVADLCADILSEYGNEISDWKNAQAQDMAHRGAGR